MEEKMEHQYKTIYHKCRKELGLTRNEASELIEGITLDRLERIENNRVCPTPGEVIMMADKYNMPHLKNYYCAQECELGRGFVQRIEIKELSQIALETLASLNAVSEKKNRLIEICVDGKITGDEMKDFVEIIKTLDNVSMTIDSLKLWTQQMMSAGLIDEEEYNHALSNYK